MFPHLEIWLLSVFDSNEKTHLNEFEVFEFSWYYLIKIPIKDHSQLMKLHLLKQEIVPLFKNGKQSFLPPKSKHPFPS